jgi:hypothetical protein
MPGFNNMFNTGKSVIDMMQAGGAGFQGQEQLGINEAMNRFDFNQMSPYLTANQQLGVVNQTTPMGMGVGQLPNTPSTLDQMMQGGLAGLGIYNAGQDAGWWGGSNPALSATSFMAPQMTMPAPQSNTDFWGNPLVSNWYTGP